MLTDPSFWVGLAFVIIISFIITKSWSFINGTLDTRSEKIASRINEAKNLREEAQALLAEYQRKQIDSQVEIKKIEEDSIYEVKSIKSKSINNLRDNINRKQSQASDRIQQSEKQAIETIKQKAINVAILATEKLIEKELTPEHQTKLISQSLNEVPSHLNQN